MNEVDNKRARFGDLSTPQPSFNKKNRKGSTNKNSGDVSSQALTRSLLFKDFAIIRHHPTTTYADGPSNQDLLSFNDGWTPINESDKITDNFKSASKKSQMKGSR